MISEIGTCVHALWARPWEWIIVGPKQFFWMERHNAAHLEAYWRHRLAEALK